MIPKIKIAYFLSNNNVVVDITKYAVVQNVNIIQNRLEDSVGEFVSSDVSITLVDDDTAKHEFANKRIRSFIFSLPSDVIMFIDIYLDKIVTENLIFRGVVTPQLIRCDKNFVYLNVLSLLKVFEDGRYNIPPLQGRADNIARYLFEIVGNVSGCQQHCIYIPNRPAADGYMDWNHAGRVQDSNTSVAQKYPMSEFVFLHNKDQVADGEYLGIIAINGVVYALKRERDGQVKLERQNTPRPIARIFRYSLQNGKKGFVLLQVYEEECLTDLVAKKFLLFRWDYLQHKLVPHTDTPNEINAPISATGVSYRVKAKNVACLHNKYAYGQTVWPQLFALAYIAWWRFCELRYQNGQYYWEFATSYSSLPQNYAYTPNAIDCVFTGNKTKVLIMTDIGVVFSDDLVSNGFSLIVNKDVANDFKFVGHYFYNSDDCFFVNNKHFMRTSTVNNNNRFEFYPLPDGLEFFGFILRNNDGFLEGLVEVKNEYAPPQWGGSVVLQPGIYAVRLSGAYPYWHFQLKQPLFAKISNKQETQALMFYDEGENKWCNIVITESEVMSAKNKRIWDIYQSSGSIVPMIFEDETINTRDMLSAIASSFSCYLLISSCAQRYASLGLLFCDGVFSRLKQWRMYPVFTIDDNVIVNDAEVARLVKYDGVKVDCNNGEEVFIGNKNSKNIIAISGRYISPAWGRIVAKDMFEMFCRVPRRVFSLRIPVRDDIMLRKIDNSFVPVKRLIGIIGAPVILNSRILGVQNVKCIITSSEYRRQDMLLDLELEEIIDVDLPGESVGNAPNAVIEETQFASLWDGVVGEDSEYLSLQPVDVSGQTRFAGIWQTDDGGITCRESLGYFDFYWEVVENWITPKLVKKLKQFTYHEEE